MGCLIYMPLILPLDAEKITLGLWSISWTKNKYSALKMHRFEDMRTCCCYLTMYNNCIPY